MTATPAGDWFAARDRERTHSPDCWQWHPGCAYSAGRREALREFAQALSEMADMAAPGTAVRGALVKVAELARERAESHRERADSAVPVSLDAGTGSVDSGAAQEASP